jgi:hypothetical protein
VVEAEDRCRVTVEEVLFVLWRLCGTAFFEADADGDTDGVVAEAAAAELFGEELGASATARAPAPVSTSAPPPAVRPVTTRRARSRWTGSARLSPSGGSSGGLFPRGV